MRRSAATGLVLALFAAMAPGCGSDDDGGGENKGGGLPTRPPPPPTAELLVTVNYPDADAENITASLHAWAVGPVDEAHIACADLVGGDLDPYDVSLEQYGDVVSKDASQPVVAPEVELVHVWVYVEAVGFDGTPEYAGCAEVDIVQPSTSVSIDLDVARVYDCSDPETEDGKPCDDGSRCTIGETCDGGSCRGGTPRDCTHVADQCNAESCDEELGCVPVPLSNNTPCDDGQYCTTSDVCTDGTCGGQPRDCSTEVGECQVLIECDEDLDYCRIEDADYGTPCDDGLFCTENDFCDSFARCDGTARDCSSVEDQCNGSICNETLAQCEPDPRSTLYSCNDQDLCTTTDRCDGLGGCAGTPLNCAPWDQDQCNVGACNATSGSCETTQVADGTACDDSNPATTNDQCTNGVCAGT